MRRAVDPAGELDAHRALAVIMAEQDQLLSGKNIAESGGGEILDVFSPNLQLGICDGLMGHLDFGLQDSADHIIIGGNVHGKSAR